MFKNVSPYASRPSVILTKMIAVPLRAFTSLFLHLSWVYDKNNMSQISCWIGYLQSLGSELSLKYCCFGFEEKLIKMNYYEYAFVLFLLPCYDMIVKSRWGYKQRNCNFCDCFYFASDISRVLHREMSSGGDPLTHFTQSASLNDWVKHTHKSRHAMHFLNCEYFFAWMGTSCILIAERLAELWWIGNVLLDHGLLLATFDFLPHWFFTLVITGICHVLTITTQCEVLERQS